MLASGVEFAFDLKAAVAAAKRWAKREPLRARSAGAAGEKGRPGVDTAERRAARANRLLGRLRENAPGIAAGIAKEFKESLGRRSTRAVITTDTVSDALLERIIGKSRDFQFVEFLEKAVFVSRSVGRIVSKLAGGRLSYGTGFMVSPRLLMTNHHVLPSPVVAAQSSIEFDFQKDRRGDAVTIRPFKLDPTTFFLNDEKLDFALVAVSPNDRGRPLAYYQWCPLRNDPGKIVTGEPINIIQHPKGELKQVVIRENRLLDSLDGAELFYHYEADTEPGSSGSPVFNDQWEVIALHHSGVPKLNKKGELLDIDGKVWRDGDDPSRLHWVANEGVRISKLVEFISTATVSRSARSLLTEFLDAEPPVDFEPSTQFTDNLDEQSTDGNEARMPSEANSPAPGTVTLTVPLQITLSFGNPDSSSLMKVVIGSNPIGGNQTAVEGALEKIEPDPGDPDYEHRPGYDENFLGFEVPFPRLTTALRSKAYAVGGKKGDDAKLIKYYNYSLIFNKSRKLAFVAGVNYNPVAKVQHPREKKGDKWFYDPRVEPTKELQTGEDLYARNPLDRGHLVRRADAGWGATPQEAKLANDDTYHFTNCAPQHEITNQGLKKRAPTVLKLWGNLEDYVASQGKKNKRRLCIFNGPVFSASDRSYRGVMIPKEFWKVIVFTGDDGEPRAAAFVLTQADLIEDLKEQFEFGEYKAVQVRLRDLESKTKLNFGPFRKWDALEKDGAKESFTGDVPAVVLESISNVVL